MVGLIWAFISTTATVKSPYKGLFYWCSHNVFIRIVKMRTLAGISAIVSSLGHSHRPFLHFFPAIKRLWSVTTAASLAIGAKPAASACNSLSGQLITNIDISVCVCVCTRSERARGRAFPTPTCHYLALQFAPLILCHFLVGCGVKTNSLHSVLKLKSIHLSKQGSLSRFGARLIPEWDSVHLSMAKKKFSQR